MKIPKTLRTFFLLFFIITAFEGFSQGSIQEAREVTAEEKRVQNIEKQIRDIRDGMSKDYDYFFDHYFLSFNPGMTDKKQLNQMIQRNTEALNFAMSADLQGKCSKINQLRKSINQYENDACSSIDNKINKLRANNIWADQRLKGLDKQSADNVAAKEQHENEIKNLDAQINDLDALLEANETEIKTYNKSNTNTSLDDFLITHKNTTKQTDFLDTPTSNGNNDLDDILSNSNGKSDDFLADTKNSDNLDDFLNTGGDATESDFKIDYKNSLTGVIDSQGKVLIPYKDWKVTEYKMGIAKVRKLIEKRKFCTAIYVAYKVGFVDNSGDFIDGYEIDFSEDSFHDYPGLVIHATSNNLTYAERVAIERKRERKKLEAQKKRKQCRLDAIQWEKSIISQYKLP